MSIRKLLLIIGLSVLFTGCSTGRYPGSDQMLAAQQGLSNADLGKRYLLGRGVPQNNEKAFTYFSKAANEDDPFAQNELAYMYAAGKGTQRDDAKSFYWYQKAADHGLASAQYNLGLMYLRGLGTPANKELAIEWFKKSASHGFEPAKQALARNS